MCDAGIDDAILIGFPSQQLIQTHSISMYSYKLDVLVVLHCFMTPVSCVL